MEDIFMLERRGGTIARERTTAKPVRENRGEAFVRLVHEAVPHQLTVLNGRGNESDPVVAQSLAKLNTMRAEVRQLFDPSKIRGLRNPVAVFDRVVHMKLESMSKRRRAA